MCIASHLCTCRHMCIFCATGEVCGQQEMMKVKFCASCCIEKITVFLFLFLSPVNEKDTTELNCCTFSC